MSILTQNKLVATDALLTDQPAMYVEGIGHLDQYGTYVDKWWSHGIIFFIRDQVAKEIEHLAPTDPARRPLADRLARLNSEIYCDGDATAAPTPTGHA